MATLHFDKVDDWVRSDVLLSTAFNAEVSIVALLRRNTSAGSSHGIFTAHRTVDFGLFFEFDSADKLMYGTGNEEPAIRTSSITIAAADTDWWLVGVSRAAATSTPRFHFKNITTGAASSHENGTGTQAHNLQSISGGYFKIGNFDNTPGNPGSADDDYGGEIAVVGAWEANLSDSQFNECFANLKTSDLWNNSIGPPLVLVELTSLSLDELGAYVTGWTVTGAALSGADPPGWVFDATGARDPQLPPVAPMGSVTPIA